MLTDVKVRTAKSGKKQIKLFDFNGLYMLISPNGGQCWRFKYRFNGKEKLLALGTYPEISRSEAREKRDMARKKVAAGIAPELYVKHRRLRKQAGQRMVSRL